MPRMSDQGQRAGMLERRHRLPTPSSDLRTCVPSEGIGAPGHPQRGQEIPLASGLLDLCTLSGATIFWRIVSHERASDDANGIEPADGSFRFDIDRELDA